MTFCKFGDTTAEAAARHAGRCRGGLQTAIRPSSQRLETRWPAGWLFTTLRPLGEAALQTGCGKCRSLFITPSLPRTTTHTYA